MLWSLITVVCLHSVVWCFSTLKKDVSIVDIFWGLGFALIAWRSAFVAESVTPLAWLLVILVSVWSIRLSGYLAWRNWGKPEDYRYRAMRDRWGGWFPLVSLGMVFLLQAFLTWIVAFPVQVGTARGGELGLFAVLGGVIWAVGLFFEAVGDYQLTRFKADPANAGSLMDRGLWRYTRHPNYFGDFLVWWGVYVASLEAGFVWWTLIGPVVMSVLLMRVSGVTLLEKSLSSRVDGYPAYAGRTNVFFPWFPKD